MAHSDESTRRLDMVQRFVAIDFETANADLASICQVGIVTFEDGNVVEAWGSLVNPEDYFDSLNVAIHGIDEDMVQHSPTFPDIYESLAVRLLDHVVISHTSFDRTAMAQSLERHRLADIGCTWLDSARVVRRTWTQLARKGYGLGNVCDILGIQYRAHDAVEDARAAGEVFIRAMSQSNLDVQGWVTRARQPIGTTASGDIVLEGNPDGPLAGEELVFTGALTIPRREAAALGAKAGCNVAAGVKKTTTLLIVGDQDIRKLAGHETSHKQQRAEELIAKGQSIRILKESDFLRLIELSSR